LGIRILYKNVQTYYYLGVIVRRATADDAEGFVRAYEASWDASIAPMIGQRLGDLVPFQQRLDGFRAGMAAASESSGAWVAENEGEIVGVAVLRADELSGLYVVPSAWGSGAAQELVEAALEGVTGDVVLWVGEDNARARRFYEREGWTQDGERRISELGPAEVRYRRRIG
jgi:GNAT superfamily N-acetyltransferase